MELVGNEDDETRSHEALASLVVHEGLRAGSPSDYCSKIVTKLADYEDAEEQGLLLRLPCAIGDTVYCIKARWKDKYGNTGTECYISKETAYHLTWIINNIDNFNKTVFLTQEAAEQKLEQMKGE